MKENKIVIKVGEINNGELKQELVLNLRWSDNWYPDIDQFYQELKDYLSSDMTCSISRSIGKAVVPNIPILPHTEGVGVTWSDKRN
mgnify:CR=1 FL=1